jgi:chemotaxis protein CheX
MTQVDVGFIKPFVEGTKETLLTLCEYNATPGKPFLKKGNPPIEIDIAGVIGITSSAFCGSITISFPEKVFLKIMGKMLGEEYNEITNEISDGAAELMNIIFGHAKRVLNAKGYDLEKAIPSIARGKSLQMISLTKSEIVILPFDIEPGRFFIEVAIDEQQKPKGK